MTESRFRAFVVAFGVSYAWYYALGWSNTRLPENVRSALAYAGQGATIPLDSPLYSVPFILGMIACIGLLMLAAWGRAMLLLSTVAGIALAPLAGVSVAPSLDAFVGSIAWTLQAFVLALAYYSPIAERFKTPDDVEEPAEVPEEGDPDERVVEVFRSSDQALLAVLESVLVENDVPFSLASEALQDLIAGGRLGGFNFAIGPARLFVRERDEARVRAIIAELQGAAPAVPEEAPS